MIYLILAVALFTIIVAYFILKDSNLDKTAKKFVYVNVILNASNGALWWIYQLQQFQNE